jgi:hypothetical protein
MENIDVDAGNQLSEAGLVEYFNGLGVTLSARQVSSWRRVGLLPDFDLPARGRGRGLGRIPGSWLGGGKVIEQALAVNELLSRSCRVEDAYLPLWLLGYDVPADRVRDSLLWPLGHIRAGITEEVSQGGWDERDFYFEIAGMLCEGIADYWEYASPGGGPLTPQQEELLFNTDETILLLCNQNYQPEDPLSPEAEFLRRHFSLDALSAAVSASSADDLRRVQEDFGCVRATAYLIANQVGHLPFLDSPGRYAILSLLGGLVALADLGLRASGHGRLIDEHLPNLPDRVRLAIERREVGIRVKEL